MLATTAEPSTGCRSQVAVGGKLGGADAAGVAVGFAVGACVGACVGAAVGLAVGVAVGLAVGLAVGVGVGDGDSLGLGLGLGFGLAEAPADGAGPSSGSTAEGRTRPTSIRPSRSSRFSLVPSESIRATPWIAARKAASWSITGWSHASRVVASCETRTTSPLVPYVP